MKRPEYTAVQCFWRWRAPRAGDSPRQLLRFHFAASTRLDDTPPARRCGRSGESATNAGIHEVGDAISRCVGAGAEATLPRHVLVTPAANGRRMAAGCPRVVETGKLPRGAVRRRASDAGTGVP